MTVAMPVLVPFAGWANNGAYNSTFAYYATSAIQVRLYTSANWAAGTGIFGVFGFYGI